MSTRIYVDANVYLDYLEERTDGIRPLDEFAFQLFKRTFGCEFEIVMSDWALQELQIEKEIKSKSECLFDDLKKAGKLVIAKRTPEDERRARLHRNWQDALHVMIATRMNCKTIVTRNTGHFLEFSSLIQAKLPENL